jgi:hypothetical protein
MARPSSIRAELDQLRAELDALRHAPKPEAPPPPAPEGDEPRDFEQQLRQLMDQAQILLDEAEDTVASHPALAVAGALALGLVIGRLTAR